MYKLLQYIWNFTERKLWSCQDSIFIVYRHDRRTELSMCITVFVVISLVMLV